tara:strand:+ start:235 stop:402 length:168 start_codon:yes stop_codon:yes gene_type:complete
MITKLTKAQKEELREMDEEEIIYFWNIFNEEEMYYLALLGSYTAQQMSSIYKKNN